MQNGDLDDLFAAARAATPQPSVALLARVEADGLRLLPRPSAHNARPSTRRPRSLRGLLADMVLAVGGLGGAAGLASAMLAGLWIGFAQPQGWSALTEGLTTSPTSDDTLDSVELIPSLDPFSTEG